jgi:murein DD-endopeptidase MepM/ murein hydrolase activator NlpD
MCPIAITNQIAEIFGTDIDFRRELRKGDSFSVVYEAHRRMASPSPGVAQPAGCWPHASSTRARRTMPSGSRRRPQGRVLRSDRSQQEQAAFLASPLAFSRVTSGFAMRFHPIQKTLESPPGGGLRRAHRHAGALVGDGVVSFSGWQNGYGNVVQCQHSGNRSTSYAHLSRMDVRGGAVGPARSVDWRRGRHRLGHRAAPALRVQGRRQARWIRCRWPAPLRAAAVAARRWRSSAAWP